MRISVGLRTWVAYSFFFSFFPRLIFLLPYLVHDNCLLSRCHFYPGEEIRRANIFRNVVTLLADVTPKLCFSKRHLLLLVNLTIVLVNTVHFLEVIDVLILTY